MDDDLPELTAFVRTLGGLNSVKAAQDLLLAGYLVRRGGRYVQHSTKALRATLFINAEKNGKHQLRVTPAGQDLIRKLNEENVFTKALTQRVSRSS